MQIFTGVTQFWLGLLAFLIPVSMLIRWVFK